MEKKIITVGLFLAVLLVVPAMAAFTIDGDLSDWGLTNLATGDWSQPATWVPTDGIVYTVEDNHNPNHAGFPAAEYGVHIQGNGHSYTFYDEPKVQLANVNPTYYVSPPYGNEKYDLEAMYFKQDADYLYIAVVTSEPPNALSDRQPGDLALNLDQSSTTGDFGYEYGVRLGTANTAGFHQGDIIKLPKWQDNSYITPQAPDIMVGMLSGGSKVGKAEIAYTNTWMTKLDNNYQLDSGVPNYVIEIKIAKSDLGLASGTPINFGSVYLAENCMNDHIYVPEFPTVAVSVGSVLGVAIIVYSIRYRRKEE